MIILNGKQYKLCLIDTNIVSEMILRPDTFLQNYFKFFDYGQYIPCFSIFSILELRQRLKVYDRFLDLFSVFPCFIVKNLELLFADEQSSYPNPHNVSPILISSPGKLIKGSHGLREILDLAFKDIDVTHSEQKWNTGKQEILDGILGLVKNFQPKNKKYTQKEIRDFLEIAGFQQIVFRALEFTQQIIKSGKPVLIDAFPSIKIIILVVFYKFYTDRRRVIESDTFDILISSVIPYVDTVITEKHLADIFFKVKKQDEFINNLEILTLKNLS